MLYFAGNFFNNQKCRRSRAGLGSVTLPHPPTSIPTPPTIPFIISLFWLGMVGGLGTLVGGWGRVTEPKPALDLLHFWLLKKFPSKYSTCKTSPGFYIRNPFKNESDPKKKFTKKLDSPTILHKKSLYIFLLSPLGYSYFT